MAITTKSKDTKGMDEGYIKYKSEPIHGPAPPQKSVDELNRIRTRLFDLGLIGMYNEGPNKGIGFGNISLRSKGNNFIVSCSATGEDRILAPGQYSEVVEYSLDKNWLKCVCSGTKPGKEELLPASSESLTHAAIYEVLPGVGAVIHVHSMKAWNALLNKVPTTAKVPYGTPEMAREMMRLINEGDAKSKKIIVMAGHPEGIISFGKDLDEAMDALLHWISPVLQIK